MMNEKNFLSDEDFDVMTQNIVETWRDCNLVKTDSCLFVSTTAHDKNLATLRMKGREFNLAIMRFAIDRKFFRRYDRRTHINLTQYQTDKICDILSMMEV